jgi:2-amino-4-hydroxy-6-hydroxymethyldihydropteridine diphosphokinase
MRVGGPIHSTEGAAFDNAVVVALGSNLAGGAGSPVEQLEAALARLPVEGLMVTSRSSWWRSAAWPDPTQPAYLNGVALVDTALSPSETLAALQAVEAQFGRLRSRRNAARTLDLDLIAYGRLVLDQPGLHLPHPRAADRRFVMGPLAEIAPAWRHPVTGERAERLAARATVGADAAPVSPAFP